VSLQYGAGGGDAAAAADVASHRLRARQEPLWRGTKPLLLLLPPKKLRARMILQTEKRASARRRRGPQKLIPRIEPQSLGLQPKAGHRSPGQSTRDQSKAGRQVLDQRLATRVLARNGARSRADLTRGDRTPVDRTPEDRTSVDRNWVLRAGRNAEGHQRSAIFYTKDKRFSFRSPKNRSQKKALGSHLT